MGTHHECNLGAALSALAMAALLVATGAGSTAVLAQTGSLQAPSSGLRTAPRTGMGVDNTPSAPLASPVAAPLAGPTGAGQPHNIHRPLPVAATPAGPVPTTGATVPLATANYAVLGTQVLQGAAVGKREKLAAVSAMLLAAARTEPDQIKKANLEAVAKAPDIDAGVSLTLANPKAALGHLTLRNAGIDFSKGVLYISPQNPEPKFGGVAYGVLCDFKRNGKQTGLYLMNFVVEIPPDASTKKMKTLIGATASTVGNTFPVSPGVQQILVPINLESYDSYVSLSSDGPFIFKSCDINTVNSPV